MPHIDLYAIYGLDRRQPPEALAAALTAQLDATEPRDTLTRNRIDTARAILGDPLKRARYDAALGNPAAPTLDENALAAIAGRHVPTTARPSLAGAFAGRQVRVLAAVAAALALVLVVGITAVACSGDDDEPADIAAASAASQQAGESSSKHSRQELEAARIDSEGLKRAAWDTDDPSSTPDIVIHLNTATALPTHVASIFQDADRKCGGVSICRIDQFQDRTIGVYGKPQLARYNQDGMLIATTDYDNASDLPKPFDLAKDASKGYFQFGAADGVAIPAAAAGTADGMQFALAILPDAFDDRVVWVLLRGGTALYRADLRWSESFITDYLGK